jgi:transcriptional regulator with XRE-family HTH domain
MARSRRRTAQSEFGSRVRQRRLEVGLTQEDLAEQAELHVTYLGGIERGVRNPALQKILLLAVALDIDPGELVRGLRP